MCAEIIMKKEIEIFDLLKGEVPELDEEVYVYDEYDETWELCDLSRTVHSGDIPQRFCPNSAGLHIIPLERGHRWTRLPILEKV